MSMHPNCNTIQKYVEGDLTRSQLARLKKHLSTCQECRNEISAQRQFDQIVRDTVEETPPDHLFALIEQRRTAGDRVLLPVHDDSRPARSPVRWRVLATAAVAMMAAVGGILSTSGDLSASRSDLMFEPAKPVAGETIVVAYTPAVELREQGSLQLRARFRTPEDDAYNSGMATHVIAELLPDGRGVFRGVFQLPDNVVYGAFAVEDPTGVSIDSNQLRLWHLVVHGADGTPLRKSIEQRQNDLMGRDWRLAYQVSLDFAREHPGPASWSALAFYERQVFGKVDSLQQIHSRRLAKSANAARSDGRLSIDMVADLFSYSRFGVADSAETEYWRHELENRNPGHPLVVQERTLEIMFENSAGESTKLQELEDLWSEVGAAHGQLIIQGYYAAIGAQDPEALLMWSNRYSDWEPHQRAGIASDLADFPSLQDTAIVWMREELERLTANGDSRRPPERTVERQALISEQIRSGQLANLGATLIDAGHTDEGRAALDEAATLGWEPRVFRRTLEAREQVGDGRGAAEMMANLFVDQTASREQQDSLRSSALAHVTTEEWTEMTDVARSRMRTTVMKESVERRIPGKVRVRDASGRRVDLGDVIEPGQLTFVAYWSRFCGPSILAMPEILKVAAKLRTMGIGTITITDEPSGPALDAYLADLGFELPVFYDQDRQTVDRITSAITPDYFILEGSEWVRFDHTALADIIRQVAVLSLDMRATSAAAN